MFTGIVEATAEVLERSKSVLRIERPSVFDDIKVGSSICVSGACLSVVALDETSMRFDVVDETWSRTNLGSLEKGDRVNLERAMKMGDRLDGHIVQGHVNGVGVVGKLGQLGVLRIAYLHGGQIVEKGSIAVDGVSLTVASVEDDSFTVALIPQTLEKTTLESLKEEDRVNVEVDVMAKGRQ